MAPHVRVNTLEMSALLVQCNEHRQSQIKPDRLSSYSHPKSVDFNKYNASTNWKGAALPDSTKSSKSVTFISHDNTAVNEETTSGLFIEQKSGALSSEEKKIRSISTKFPWLKPQHIQSGAASDMDLWLAFLLETGLLNASSLSMSKYTSETTQHHETKVDDPVLLIKQLEDYHKDANDTFTTNIRDYYEGIHRKCPGLFWDTVTMDNPDEAFKNVKRIIKNIVKQQNIMKPMFDINFANMQYYPTVEKKLKNICSQIAPQSLFY